MDYGALLFLLSFILVSSCIYVKKIFSTSSKLPPGPKPLPIIGNLFELGEQPHQSLAKLSKTYGPLMTLKLGAITTIVVSSPETAQQILQKYDHVLCNRLLPDVARAVDHDKYSVGWLPVASQWRLLRKVLAMQMFTAQRLDAGQALRHEKVKQLLNLVQDMCKSGDNKSLDIGLAAFTTVLNFLSNTFFSFDMAQYQSDLSQEFRNHVVRVLELAGSPNIADYFPVLKPIDPQGARKRIAIPYRKMIETFEQIMDERVKLKVISKEPSAHNDVLDALLNLREKSDYKLSDNDIKHLLLDVFSAGTDTSSSTVEWAMAELMCNPSKMVKVQAELEEVIGKDKKNYIQESDISRLPYLQAVVKETLRLHPPAPLLLPHKAETNVEICGFTVPQGSQILVNVWAIGRDPNTWSNPNLFEPERFLVREIEYKGRDFEFIPFGAGRRICPGLPLAHRMVHLILASLLHSFQWKLENGMKPEDVDMNEAFGLTLQKAQPLRAIPMTKGLYHISS